jgi:hypothetical protein
MSRTRTVGLRLAVTALVAVTAIFALEWFLRQEDAALRDEQLRVALASAKPLPQPPVLGVQTELVWLCAAFDSVPPLVAPVVQILRDGSFAVRKAAPVATLPGPRTVAAIALLLPVKALPDLTAIQRAALLDQLSAIFTARPIASGQVQCAGLAGESADLAALLSWVR